MFRKLINFATTMIKDHSAEPSEPEPLATPEVEDSISQSSVPTDAKESGAAEASGTTEKDVPTTASSHQNRATQGAANASVSPQMPVSESTPTVEQASLSKMMSVPNVSHDQPSALEWATPQADETNQTSLLSTTAISLETLYSSMSLEQGMLHVATSAAQHSPSRYVQLMDQWGQEQDFASKGAIAVAAKRRGDYGEAMDMFNLLAQTCPHFFQIHNSTMKVLGAAGDVEQAFRALQLWCVAVIPEKALRQTSSPLSISDSAMEQDWQFSHLAGWAIAMSKSMYHLGSLKLILSGELDPNVRQAYLSSLRGKNDKPLHDPKKAVAYGKSEAMALPWQSLQPIADSELWQRLLHQSTELAMNLNQHRSAA